MLTTKQAAERLGVSSRRVLALVEAGDLAARAVRPFVDDRRAFGRRKRARVRRDLPVGRSWGGNTCSSLKPYTLMNRNHAVLDFVYDDERKRVSIERVREGAAWAPVGRGPCGGRKPDRGSTPRHGFVGGACRRFGLEAAPASCAPQACRPPMRSCSGRLAEPFGPVLVQARRREPIWIGMTSTSSRTATRAWRVGFSARPTARRPAGAREAMGAHRRHRLLDQEDLRAATEEGSRTTRRSPRGSSGACSTRANTFPTR